MSLYEYDLFVIGAGSGGVRAARLAARAGAKVAIAEDAEVGGTCVVRGCVPKKLLVHGAEFAGHMRDAAGFGWTIEPAKFSWPTLRDNVQAEVHRLSGLYLKNLSAAGAELIAERARVVEPQVVQLASGRKVTAKRILVATGGHTYRPKELKGQELAITSTDAFLLEKLPKSILIVGGGYIALEFATVFCGLGVETTVVYRGDKVLRGFDHDVRAHVQMEMTAHGISILNNVNLTEISEAANGQRIVKLDNGQELQVDQVMLAVGREPNTPGLGLEDVGVKLNARGAVMVDPYGRSSVESISAVGDVTDRLNLTPVAIREAVAFIETEFMGRPTAFDHADVASAVFCKPTVGVVGLTEAQAREQGRVRIFKTLFRPMRNILANNPQRTLMKLVVDAESDVVVGVHLAGPEAAELIQVAAIAVKAKLTKAQWDATCAVHPTAAEELVLMGEPVAHDNEAPA
ncbi:MAG: glutathione-disulfide reductase [Hyphomonadaceae bacterium]|nr:glutathione-disulfide reductase [Hyphomonadaceae bacterium]